MRIFLFCLLILSLISCGRPEGFLDAEVGNDFVDVSSKIYFIDTLSIETSTFKFDSITANSPPRLLIGNYDDDVFGSVKSKTYLQVINNSFFIDNDGEYDSIAFVLDYDGYYYNDTLNPQKLYIYEVTDEIQPDEDFYYNTTEFEYNTNPLGEANFFPRPTKATDSVFIKMNQAFGAELFEDIQDNVINNTEDFIDKYKGFLIEGDPTNNGLLGFRRNSFIRIYYTIENELGNDDRTYDLPIVIENTFNNIVSETSGTPFAALTDQEVILPSTENDDNTFIQNGIGIATRLEIKDVESLYNIPGEGVLLDARLKLTVKKRTRNDLRPIRDSLGVFIVDKNAEILGNLIDPVVNEQVIGVLDTSGQEFDIITYEFFILPFLEQLLEAQTDDELFLAFFSQEFGSSINRYILYGENSNDEVRAKIELLYAIYDDEDE